MLKDKMTDVPLFNEQTHDVNCWYSARGTNVRQCHVMTFTFF